MKENMNLNITIPSNVKILSFERDNRGESNEVYICKGIIDKKSTEFYIKKRKGKISSLNNENVILEKLKTTTIPCPSVLWYTSEENDEHLAITKIDQFNCKHTKDVVSFKYLFVS